MVEGHSVHRVATLHRKRLVGKTFKAASPNGRFKAGAESIDGKIFRDIQAVGKNLFAFFGNEEAGEETVVVHVHFGMSGAWAVYEKNEPVPEPTKTNRLRLVNKKEGIVADLSAMTVSAGGMELYEQKRSQLGQDPLRDDADPELLWKKVRVSKKSIGALLMDQSFFAGPGNIYRAEILYKSGVHPDVPGKDILKEKFDGIWEHTVALLRRGYETGSILTVDPDEAVALGKPRLRRYIYNTKICPRCSSKIQVWTIAARTCYACPTCQPKVAPDKSPKTTTATKKECEPFVSHCAPESLSERLKNGGPEQLTVAELKAELALRNVTVPKRAVKKSLVKLLRENLFLSSEAAAASKAAAGEGLAVEHVAELAPGQTRRARNSTNCRKRRPSSAAAVVTPIKEEVSSKRRSKRSKR